MLENGGSIGPKNNTTFMSASGIWGLTETRLNKINNIWPKYWNEHFYQSTLNSELWDLSNSTTTRLAISNSILQVGTGSDQQTSLWGNYLDLTNKDISFEIFGTFQQDGNISYQFGFNFCNVGIKSAWDYGNRDWYFNRDGVNINLGATLSNCKFLFNISKSGTTSFYLNNSLISNTTVSPVTTTRFFSQNYRSIFYIDYIKLDLS